MTTVEQMVGINGQCYEILKRVGNGSLDPVAVKRALQNIIEGKLPLMQNWNPPTWWRTCDQQLAYACQLWPNVVLPEPPKEFIPRTKSEVLLLHVPDTFEKLWDLVDAPIGYTKPYGDGVNFDKQNLRLAPGKVEFMEPVWLAFDPERGKGERPDSFWGQNDLAASEVFSAMIQFPEWSLTWGANRASAPNLTGYQLKYEGDWSHVLFLRRHDWPRKLGLFGCRANWESGYASPSVRVLNG